MSERDQQIIQMAKQGIPYGQIGELLGLSRQRVSQICLKNGLIRRPNDVKPELWQEDWIANLENGGSLEKI